jgi:hypothetical protein
MEDASNSPIPPNMIDFMWRSIGQNDLAAIIELSQKCLAVDGGNYAANARGWCKFSTPNGPSQ